MCGQLVQVAFQELLQAVGAQALHDGTEGIVSPIETLVEAIIWQDIGRMREGEGELMALHVDAGIGGMGGAGVVANVGDKVALREDAELIL